MARSKVSIHGIAAGGRHGANPGERDEPQGFRIDVEVDIEVGADELDASADYRALADVARTTVESTSFVLLESLAQAVADRLREVAGVASARVTVHKPTAARSMSVEDVAATAISGG
jgi:dihydroneopterin aldolase